MNYFLCESISSFNVIVIQLFSSCRLHSSKLTMLAGTCGQPSTIAHFYPSGLSVNMYCTLYSSITYRSRLDWTVFVARFLAYVSSNLPVSLYTTHRYQHLGEMMTLGTNDGAVSVSFIDGITLDGILGHTGTSLSEFCFCSKDYACYS